MQSMEVISINIWQILISLLNLVILFLILKRFLFKPVKKIMAARESDLNEQYAKADEAERCARADKEAWEEKLQTADTEAQAVMAGAAEKAQKRSEKILAEAKGRAGSIVQQAEAQAVLEREKAEAGIKQEIVAVSAALTEKMLEREINQQDHRALIDAFIEKMDGEAHE